MEAVLPLYSVMLLGLLNLFKRHLTSKLDSDA